MNIKKVRRRKLLQRNTTLQKYSELLEGDTQRSKFDELLEQFRTNDLEWIVDGMWKRKSFTCELVMKVFIWGAIRAHEQTNCLTELFFDDALKTAKQYDEEFKSTGKMKGPLYGIPISLKDNLAVKGYDSTLGNVSRAFTPLSINCPIVQTVIDAGAIPFVKTNVPQTLLSFECSNYIWGSTTNPANSTRSPGGSSGGEAALIACGGSVIGIGNDVGGSLRIPAHFCGIYALKPTFGRISNEHASFAPFQDCIRCVNGPMANSCANLKTLFKVMVNGYHGVPKIPWTPFVPNRTKLTFGKMSIIGPVVPTTSCSRALLEVELKLRMAGHEVKEVRIDGLDDGIFLFYQLMSADGFRNFRKATGKEPLETHIKPLFDMMRIPSFLRRFSIWMYEKCGANKDFCKILQSCCETSVGKVWRIQDEISTYQSNIRRQLEDLHVDCIICPGFACPATKLDTFSYISFCAIYSFIWNIVDVPVGVIPVTKVEPSIDSVKRERLSLFSSFDYAMNATGLFDAVEMTNLPVGIQLVSPIPFDDEKILYRMEYVDSLLKEKK